MTETQTPEQYARQAVERMVTQAEDARAKAAKQVNDYRVSQMWSIGDLLIDAAIGEQAQDLLDRAEVAFDNKGKTFAEMITWTRDRITDQLVTGSMESHSTSSLSNAFADAEREGARRFLRSLNELTAWIEAS